MGPPTVWQSLRQTLGRAVRETGQALDRAGVQVASFALTKDEFYDDPVIYQDHLSRHRQLFPLLGAGKPVVSPQVAFVAPCATLIGSVRVHAGASVWYGAVLRADYCQNAEAYRRDDQEILEMGTNEFELEEDKSEEGRFRYGGGIYVGENTNLQDGSIVTAKTNHCKIGNGVTVGHLAQIHSATIEDFCLIGMGSVIGQGAHIETESFVAAGAVVKPGETIKAGELWIGNPARKLRDLTAEQREKLHYQSDEYVKVATGQRGVMELGGNLTESILDELEALPDGEKTVLPSDPSKKSDQVRTSQ